MDDKDIESEVVESHEASCKLTDVELPDVHVEGVLPKSPESTLSITVQALIVVWDIKELKTFKLNTIVSLHRSRRPREW